LASNQSRNGDEFEASLSAPVVVAGKAVIPKGARVHGRVIEVQESGRLHHVAQLRLALRSLEVGAKSYPIQTNSITRTGANHNKRNVELIGGGAGVGALIGGIAGGGKGALIGGAAGAGAGTATAAATGKKDIIIPAETHLSFRLTQPVTIEVKG
jgi:carbonic anhydrase/acetyltransferase-like protein (isoleucine patch superfamily)